MGGHGGASFWSVLQSEPNRAATALADPQQGASGFRHFMGALGPSRRQRFKLYGKPFDPSDARMWSKAEELMEKLAAIVWAEQPPKDENGVSQEFNPNLPSGYTYFLQFVAHDLVHSSIFVSRNKGQLSGLANIRRFPLRLETLYGGGSTECPHAYQTHPSRFRNRLRLGCIRETDGPVSCPGEELDVPRARAPGVGDDVGYPEVLIGDPRNDSHAILSQMVMVAHHIHNAVLATIEADTSIASSGNEFTDAQRAFLAAQNALIIIYRSLIRDHLLPRILHPAVNEAYRCRRVPLLNSADGLDQGRWLAPLEFSYGFFRFAHAMVRHHYTFQQGVDPFTIIPILRHNSEFTPKSMPFERHWVVHWKHFFSEEPAEGNNFSVRIGPWGQQQSDGVSTNEPRRSGNLMFRDLVSSISTQPWSIGALVDVIRPTHGELLNRSALFQRRGKQRQMARHPSGMVMQASRQRAGRGGC
jgi:hypothetical protein